MRQYELMYILDPSLEEDQQNALVERFQTLIGAQGGTIQHHERWERRRLAYEIKGRREGYYVVMNFTGSPAAEAELTRVLGITDGVLRHLIVKMDERTAQKAIAEAKAAAEAKARAEAEAREAAEAQAAQAAAQAAAAPAPEAPAAPTVPAAAPADPAAEPAPAPAEPTTPAEPTAPAASASPAETAPAAAPAGEGTDAPQGATAEETDTVTTATDTEE
jgi:small subunit ribosomal protein S6